MTLTPGTLTVMIDVAWRVTLILAGAWLAVAGRGTRLLVDQRHGGGRVVCDMGRIVD